MGATAVSKHPFHLVDPSPWPILGSAAGGVTAVGALLYMRDMGLAGLILGLGLVVLTMILWWRDVVDESIVQKAHTDEVAFGLRFGVVLFILSEVMFFVAFFWAYFNASLFPPEAIGGVWPPKNIKTFDPFDLPFLNTLLLLLSGCTVTWAHHAVKVGNQKDTVQALFYTVLIGFTFLGVQALEYSHAAFSFKDGIYPSTFYMATGFHGFHVFVGAVFLAVCLLRARKGHFTPERHIGLEAAAWYWHFVDVVWLFLFISIYWAGS